MSLVSSGLVVYLSCPHTQISNTITMGDLEGHDPLKVIELMPTSGYVYKIDKPRLYSFAE